MFRFICKNLVQKLSRVDVSTRDHARLLQTLTLNSIPNISKSKVQHSPTVSYLVNSCGLSLDSAISASKKVQIETSEKPDSVLQLFKTYGFTKTQITDIITKHPQFLVSKADKTLKPKFDYFESVGLRSHLAKLILLNKNILLYSLDQRIIPNVNFLKTILPTNEDLVASVKQCSYILCTSLDTCIEPNISTLRAHGLPDSKIVKLLLLQPRSVLLSPDKFKDVLRMVEEMGFNPQSQSFVLAVRSLSVMSKLKWERKVEALKSFGWTNKDILEAFKLQPMCMLTSEKKLKKLMEFFVNELGIKSCDVVKCPNLLLVGLEKRVIPRCSVLQVLVTKKLVDRKDLNVKHALISSRVVFEKRYLVKYQETCPDILKAYQGKMGYSTLDKLWPLS